MSGEDSFMDVTRNETTDEEELYEVEKIIGKTKMHGEWMYKVRWKGYGPGEDTWEPKENLETCLDLIQEFDGRQKELKHKRAEERKRKKALLEEKSCESLDVPRLSPQSTMSYLSSTSKDTFWKDLEEGRISLLDGNDMYSKLKCHGRGTRPSSFKSPTENISPQLPSKVTSSKKKTGHMTGTSSKKKGSISKSSSKTEVTCDENECKMGKSSSRKLNFVVISESESDCEVENVLSRDDCRSEEHAVTSVGAVPGTKPVMVQCGQLPLLSAERKAQWIGKESHPSVDDSVEKATPVLKKTCLKENCEHSATQTKPTDHGTSHGCSSKQKNSKHSKDHDDKKRKRHESVISSKSVQGETGYSKCDQVSKKVKLGPEHMTKRVTEPSIVCSDTEKHYNMSSSLTEKDRKSTMENSLYCHSSDYDIHFITDKTVKVEGDNWSASNEIGFSDAQNKYSSKLTLVKPFENGDQSETEVCPASCSRISRCTSESPRVKGEHLLDDVSRMLPEQDQSQDRSGDLDFKIDLEDLDWSIFNKKVQVKSEEPSVITDEEFREAVLQGNAKVVMEALASGMIYDVEAPNMCGQTLLMKAVHHGYNEVCEDLIENGANVNAQQKDGTTALMIACLSSEVSTVALLLENGANINTKNIDGDSALILAARHGHRAIVQLLLDYGSNFGAQNNRGYTALSLANTHISRTISDHVSRVVQEFDDQVSITLNTTAKILSALFPLQCQPVSDGNKFVIKFQHSLQPVVPGVGHLMFIANCIFLPEVVCCRFYGPCAVTSVFLNGILQPSLTEDANYVLQCCPLKNGINELLIHTIDAPNSKADESVIGHLHEEITRLLRKFMGKFVQTHVIKSSTSMTSVEFSNPDNQHPDSNLAVGMSVRTYLNDNSDDLSPSTIKSFFSYVRQFYIEVTSKIVKKFPFHDSTLQTLAFVNSANREKIDPDAVVELAQRFDVCSDADALRDEITEFQLAADYELPEVKGEEDSTGLDKFWIDMEEKITLFNGQHMYQQFAKIAVVVLSLPHSNAAAERSFSMLRKIQSDERGNLGVKTISSLMSTKMNVDSDCCDWVPSIDVLNRSKSASYQYKLAHQSTQLCQP